MNQAKNWAADRPIVVGDKVIFVLTSEMFETLSGALFERRCSKSEQKIISKNAINCLNGYMAIVADRNFDTM